MSEAFDFHISVECFKEICRVCLKQTECLISIHEVVFTQNSPQGIVQGILLSIVLNKYCNVSVHKEDLKPQNICMPCVEMIAKAFDIFERFLVSNIHLDKILRQHESELAKGNEEIPLKMTKGSVTILTNTKKHKTISGGSVGYVDEPIENINEDDSNSEISFTSDHIDNSVENQENKIVIGDIKSGLTAKLKRNISTQLNAYVDAVVNPIDKIESEIFDDSKSDITFEAQETIIISNSDQLLEEQVKVEGFDDQDITLEEDGSKSLHMCTSSEFVNPPNTGQGKWDHTYYTSETKCLITNQGQIRRRKYRQPNLRKRKGISEFQVKKLLLAFKRKNEIFNCKFCEGIQFKGIESIIKHLQSVHPLEDECIICSKKFSKINLLLPHVASHGRKRHLVCNKCFILFKDKESLDAHMASADHIQNTTTCKICSKSFKKQHRLKSHIQEVHLNEGSQKTQCPKCGIMLKYRGNLQKHLRTHREISERKSFLCEHCAKVFTTSTHLRRHTKIEHEGQVHLREHYRIKAREFRRRTKEKWLPKNGDDFFSCEYCSKTFTSRGPFFKHRISHPECKDVTCPFCGRMFESALAYKRHRIADHSSFICIICQKGCPSKIALSQHIYYTHKACKFQCSVCPARFRTSQSLKVHENVHFNVRPYACQYCDKKFTQNNHLIQHEVCMHTKEKKFQCHVCNKAFQYNYSLKGHIRSHFGVKPFKCPYCSKNFTDTVGRHKHVKFFHADQMEDFTLFKKVYQAKENMRADVIDVTSENGENIEAIPVKPSSFSRKRKKAVIVEQVEEIEDYSEGEHEMIDDMEESSSEDEAPFDEMSDSF